METERMEGASGHGDSRGRPSMIALAGWAVLIAAVLVWEGLGLVKEHDQWPTFSDMLRKVTHTAPGRWLLFGVWLWLGWHLFVRGWRFFLRA